jgi:PAS domain S-box-containing protein
LILDAHGNFSYANPLFRETFSHSSLEATSVSRLFSLPDRKKFIKAIEQCEKNPRSVVTISTTIKPANATSKDILWEISSIKERGAAETIQAVGIHNCLAQRDDNIANTTNDGTRSLGHIVNNPRFGVVMRSADGKALFYNKTALDFSGLSEAEFLNTTLPVKNVLFIKEDGSALPEEQHPTLIATRERKPVKDTVLGVCRKNSKEFRWILTNAEPINNDKGKLVHVITTFIDITERKKIEQRLIVEEINKQKIIIRATIEGQEKERNEISKELHDNIGQLLTTTQLYLEIARATADKNTLEMIRASSKSVTQAIAEIRKLSRSLTPPALGDLGLVESVKDLCDGIKTTQVFTIRFYHKHFNERFLEHDTKLMLFRIIQEQINNIIKYACASIILIRLTTERGQLELVVSDNGRGFDPATARKGLGLNNIINRAELFNGKAEIKSTPGQGSTVTVTVPIL